MYTDEKFQKDNKQLQKRRKYTRSLLKELACKAENMWMVVCVYVSPINGSFEHRECWFLDFVEADMFRNMLDETYKKLPGLDYHIYCFHTDKEIIEAVFDRFI